MGGVCWFYILALAALASYTWVEVEAQSSYQRMHQVMTDLTKDYSKAVRPHFFGKEVMVGIQLLVNGMPNIDEKNFQFSLDMYFRQFWKDERLKFSPDVWPKLKHASLKHRVWTPDPFFVNQKEGKVLDNPADNTIFSISNTGDILFSSRQLVTTYCPMNLADYPFDTQKCSLEIESFAHSIDEIRYFWKDGNSSVTLNKDIETPNFRVLGHKLSEKLVTLATGSYNRLVVTFYVQRNKEKFVHNSVVPASGVVMMSALAFWLPPLGCCGHRALILVLSVASLLAVYLRSANSLVIGYVTTADYFFFCCFAFLALNVGIFLFVLVVRRRVKVAEEEGRCEGSACLRKCAWVDGLARLFFVPAFIFYMLWFVNQGYPVVEGAHDLIKFDGE